MLSLELLNCVIITICPRAGAECRAKLLIPLGDLLHPGTMTLQSGIQSCARFEQVKTGNQQPPD